MKTLPLAIAALAALFLCAARPAGAVGFQWAMASDPDDKPLQVAIWYPSAAAATTQQFGPFQQSVALGGAVLGRSLPLIVMSHGTGGSLFNSFDTAIAFAEAGFVVVAVTHTGDNYQDRSDSFHRRNFESRPRHVSRVIDYMLGDWPGHEALDPSRIGIFGHSAGGTTALIVIGGRADFRQVIAFCRDHGQDWGCRNARQHNGDGADPDAAAPPVAAADARIKAAILAAPAVGEAFVPNGLAAVKVPVQLWVAAKDDVVADADRIRRLLPVAPDAHVVAGGGHFAFLAPCSDILRARAPEICEDPAGFDRPAFLKGFQQAAVVFFKKSLSP
jgi:predicted dienelactone hydrolase